MVTSEIKLSMLNIEYDMHAIYLHKNVHTHREPGLVLGAGGAINPSQLYTTS